MVHGVGTATMGGGAGCRCWGTSRGHFPPVTVFLPRFLLIFVWAVAAWGSSNPPQPAASKFRSLRPIPSCSGVYVTDGSRIDAAFLAPARMETEQAGTDTDDVLLLNILPVPVRSDVESAIQAASHAAATAAAATTTAFARDIITSRDGGFFDNLQTVPVFQGSKLPGANRETATPVSAFSPAKKAVFDYVVKKKTGPSPYHAMVEVNRPRVCLISVHCDLCVHPCVVLCAACVWWSWCRPSGRSRGCGWTACCSRWPTARAREASSSAAPCS